MQFSWKCQRKLRKWLYAAVCCFVATIAGRLSLERPALAECLRVAVRPACHSQLARSRWGSCTRPFFLILLHHHQLKALRDFYLASNRRRLPTIATHSRPSPRAVFEIPCLANFGMLATALWALPISAARCVRKFLRCWPLFRWNHARLAFSANCLAVGRLTEFFAVARCSAKLIPLIDAPTAQPTTQSSQ